MNMKKIFARHCCWIGALLMLVFISACSGAPTEAPPTTPPPTHIPTEPPSAPTETPAPPPAATAVPPATAEAQGDFQPLRPNACSDLASTMALTLGIQVLEMEAPFQDYISGKAGTGCQTTATGTGLDFENLVVVANTLREILEAQRWQEDVMYVADGPNGTATGFRKANGVCLLSVSLEPSEDANCHQTSRFRRANWHPSSNFIALSSTVLRIYHPNSSVLPRIITEHSEYGLFVKESKLAHIGKLVET